MENVGVWGVDEAVVDGVADAVTVEDVWAGDEPDSTGLDILSCGPAKMFPYWITCHNIL